MKIVLRIRPPPLDAGPHLSPSTRHIPPSSSISSATSPALSPKSVAPTHNAITLPLPPAHPSYTSSPQTYHYPTGTIPPSPSNPSLHKLTTLPLLPPLLTGHSALLLAYGQTGAGKTYTITGDESYPNRGLLPRTLTSLYKLIKPLTDEGKQVTVNISYGEIYNEQAYDLLADEPGKPVAINSTGDVVTGLGVYHCEDEGSALALLFKGLGNRRTAATKDNDVSSRSHAVFEIGVTTATDVKVTTGTLQIVDLAGSERVNKGEAFMEGMRRLSPLTPRGGGRETRSVESGSINLSLHHLQQVIIALQTAQLSPKSPHHIPYRNSVLTTMLRNTLSLESTVVFVGCLNLTVENYEESLGTLMFMQRCGEVEGASKQMSFKVKGDRAEHTAELERANANLTRKVERGERECELLKENVSDLEIAVKNLKHEASSLKTERDEARESVESPAKANASGPVIPVASLPALVKTFLTRSHPSPELFDKTLTKYVGGLPPGVLGDVLEQFRDTFEGIALENVQIKKERGVVKRKIAGMEEEVRRYKELEDLGELRGRLEKVVGVGGSPAPPNRTEQSSPPRQASPRREPTRMNQQAKIYAPESDMWVPATCVGVARDKHEFVLSDGSVVSVDLNDVSLVWAGEEETLHLEEVEEVDLEVADHNPFDDVVEDEPKMSLLATPHLITKHTKAHIPTNASPAVKKGGWSNTSKQMYFWMADGGRAITSKVPPRLKNGEYFEDNQKVYELGEIEEVAVKENKGGWDVVILGKNKQWFITVVENGRAWALEAMTLNNAVQEFDDDDDWNNVVGMSPEPVMDLSDV